MSEEGIESEEVIQEVISDAFKHLNMATARYSSLELSGLGTYLFATKKSQKMLPNYKEAIDKQTNNVKRKHLTDMVKYMEGKIDE